jgi:immune inhibitor A
VNRFTSGALAATAAAALAAALVQQPATAALSGRAPSQQDNGSSAHRQDNRPGPLTDRQNELRQAAVQKLIDGEATKRAQGGGGSVVKLGKDKAVEFFDNKKQANVFSILSQFGDTVVGKYGGDAGPAHNQIPEPDEAKDNSTTWVSDFNQAHYDDMFNGAGESFKNFYRDLSGGQYTANGTVEDWVTVPYNNAYYGANPREDEGGAWQFIDDTSDAWFNEQAGAGMSTADINAYLSQFDKWDRYDFDGDGNFNEADGYIDHFQAIHAGEGEEAGASADAIWSHRWYVYNGYGSTGPSVGGTLNKLGGAQIGNSDYYIGDYTVEPENGGLGVFAHEYGHDLGLPDFYDTAGGENGTAFWTLMSSGSWLGHGQVDADGDGAWDGIGTTPGLMGPDERMFLGWLDAATVDPGQSGSYTLSAAGDTTPASGTHEAVVVNLPDQTTQKHYTTPPEGTHAWWSGRADDLNNTLTREVPAASRVTVTAAAWYQIEAGFDFLYGEYSTDGGQTWQSAGNAVDGASNGWGTLRYSYRADGQPSLFRFRYQTDGGVNEAGAFLDSIEVTAGRDVVVTDGAEDGANGWTADGWAVSTGTDEQTTPRYFLLENRDYVGYDKTLQQGPYQFSQGYTAPNWVEFFSFQNGMLVWYADKAYADNNTSQHPGHGQALPVDVHPEPFTYPDGTAPSNRRQPFDATFGLEAPEQVCLHKQVLVGNGKNQHVEPMTACSPESAAQPLFTDSGENAYWSADNPQNSTKLPGSGVSATVTGQDADTLTVSVVNPAG